MCPWINKTHFMKFLTCHKGNLTRRPVFNYSIEKSIHQRVWISFPTDTSKSTMKESCVLKHLPNSWVSPIIWNILRKYFYLEIIVPSLEKSWTCINFFNIETNKVLSSLFKSIVEGLFVLFSLSFTIRNETITISHKD